MFSIRDSLVYWLFIVTKFCRFIKFIWLSFHFLKNISILNVFCSINVCCLYFFVIYYFKWNQFLPPVFFYSLFIPCKSDRVLMCHEIIKFYVKLKSENLKIAGNSITINFLFTVYDLPLNLTCRLVIFNYPVWLCPVALYFIKLPPFYPTCLLYIYIYYNYSHPPSHSCERSA